jgi:septation ring formation regulator EzrA
MGENYETIIEDFNDTQTRYNNMGDTILNIKGRLKDIKREHMSHLEWLNDTKQQRATTLTLLTDLKSALEAPSKRIKLNE